jgi:hypothetical protein
LVKEGRPFFHFPGTKFQTVWFCPKICRSPDRPSQTCGTSLAKEVNMFAREGVHGHHVLGKRLETRVVSGGNTDKERFQTILFFFPGTKFQSSGLCLCVQKKARPRRYLSINRRPGQRISAPLDDLRPMRHVLASRQQGMLGLRVYPPKRPGPGGHYANKSPAGLGAQVHGRWKGVLRGEGRERRCCCAVGLPRLRGPSSRTDSPCAEVRLRSRMAVRLRLAEPQRPQHELGAARALRPPWRPAGQTTIQRPAARGPCWCT